MPTPRIIIQPGDRYGQLVILRETTPHGNGRAYRAFECLCNCGDTVSVMLKSLRSGHTVSCGCVASSVRLKNSSAAKTHGDTQSPEYQAWRHMRYRCYVSTSSEYHRYGALGVTVCAEWRGDYSAFLLYVGRRPGPEYSLDRWPDPFGNYEPGNVRWATPEQQMHNLRNNNWVVLNGERRLLVEAARELGFNPRTILNRRQSGVPDENLFKAIRGGR
jgi:hypothetical protein